MHRVKPNLDFETAVSCDLRPKKEKVRDPSNDILVSIN